MLVNSANRLGNKINKKSYFSEPPPVCPKPNCKGTSFVPHEDGWQCINCMKIIYDKDPLPYIANNRPERIGKYGHLESKMEEFVSEPEYFGSVETCIHHDLSIADCPILGEDILDWFLEYSYLEELNLK